MEFILTPTRVTKEILLDKHTEEEYMSFYLGIVPDKDMHLNPLRADKHPTASFYRSKKGELIFKDWKTSFHANFIDVVMSKFQCGYGRAITIIANDFGIAEKPYIQKNTRAVEWTGEIVKDTDGATIQAELQPFTEDQLKWWNSFGITTAELKRYSVHSVKHVFLNGALRYSSTSSNPIYGYYFGREEGRELWKMYFPLKTKYRFLLNTNKLQGAKQLPKEGDFVVVTKSMKDVMLLNRMGVAAVAPQAESVIITMRQYLALKKRFKRVIFNGDWDGAGIRFMQESRRRFEGIALSFKDKGKYAKDISDYTKKVGFNKAKAYVDSLSIAINAGKFDNQFHHCKSE